MTLQDVIKRIYYQNQLGTNFAEPATFLPGDGDSERTVWAAFSKRQRVEADQLTEDHNEEFEVMVGRDRQHEKGGVDNLIEGDSFIRDRSRDPSQSQLTFTGEILEERQHYIRGVFKRHKRIAQSISRGRA